MFGEMAFSCCEQQTEKICKISVCGEFVLVLARVQSMVRACDIYLCESFDLTVCVCVCVWSKQGTNAHKGKAISINKIPISHPLGYRDDHLMISLKHTHTHSANRGECLRRRFVINVIMPKFSSARFTETHTHAIKGHEIVWVCALISSSLSFSWC